MFYVKLLCVSLQCKITYFILGVNYMWVFCVIEISNNFFMELVSLFIYDITWTGNEILFSIVTK